MNRGDKLLTLNNIGSRRRARPERKNTLPLSERGPHSVQVERAFSSMEVCR